jgi:hypothetical protein
MYSKSGKGTYGTKLGRPPKQRKVNKPKKTKPKA